jgi:hypothetical protein
MPQRHQHDSVPCCAVLCAALQEWYEAFSQIIQCLSSSMTGSLRENSLNNGSTAGLTPGEVSMEPSPFTSPVSSFPVSLWGLFLWAMGAVLLPVALVGALALAAPHVGAVLAVHVGELQC